MRERPKVVASRQRVTPQTVSQRRARFVEHRLDGLLDAPRPGAPRTIQDTQVDAVIAKTLESVPDGATHWSTRTMAREAGLSQTAVSRIWRAFGLQPQRRKPSSSPPSRSSSKRCATSSGCTWTRPLWRWCCARTRRARCKLSTARSRCFLWRRASPSGARTTTNVTARPR